MRIMLDRGASVEIEDLQGQTPLFDAVRSTIKNVDKKKAVRLLLKAGASPRHSNRKDETPLTVAENARRPESKDIVKTLRQSR